MILFDGGMGTMLQRYGLTGGGCPDYYNISHPDIVQRIHREYRDAGSEWITTDTFGSTPIKLADYGLEDKVEAIAAAAVRNIRAACGDSVKIAGDMGPTGKFVAPLGDLSVDETYDNFYRLAKALADAGADAILIETIIDIQEMKTALLAAKDACRLPVICSMTYAEDGRTVTGTTPREAAILLDAMGADVIGANCSVGPEKLLTVAKEMVKYTNRPILIQPNAGMPILENGTTRYPATPEDFGRIAPAYAEAGITYFGGCCGTTPAHIAAERAALAGWGSSHQPVKPFTALTSRTTTVFIGDNFPPVKIGERINPTGRKKMREDLKAGSFVSVKKEALAEVDAGAEILDVNMGVPGVDQKGLMETAISQLSSLCPVPFSIDSTDPAVIERALRLYPGRPLINSANAENEETLEAILHLAKRYGAALLLLPLEKGNLPKTAEERLRVMTYIIGKAKEAGLRKQDLLADPLVLTIGSGAGGATETLKTIRLYKEKFGLPCVMGTSNVSFGLPSRPRINAAFLTMAFACGMNAPIVNPLDQGVKDAFVNAKLLLGFDKGAAAFIRETSDAPEETATAKPISNLSPVEQLKNAIKHGEKESAAAAAKAAIEAGTASETIIKDGMTAAMQDIGDGYSKGTIFLPQMMLAAEAMQAAFKVLKEILPASAAKPKGTFVIGTVAGDIHDLGKNIVAALMENSGYHVVDLGKDVAPETFLTAATKSNADLIGLCSLMTTTLPSLEKTVKLAHEKMPRLSVMVGGAVVTKDYAASIGADAYCKDGVAAVRNADKLMESHQK